MGRALAAAVLQRAAVRQPARPRGVAPAVCIQRTFDEARSAVYNRLYGAEPKNRARVGLEIRATFDAAFSNWHALSILESRFTPQEWATFRYLNDRGARGAPDVSGYSAADLAQVGRGARAPLRAAVHAPPPPPRPPVLPPPRAASATPPSPTLPPPVPSSSHWPASMMFLPPPSPVPLSELVLSIAPPASALPAWYLAPPAPSPARASAALPASPPPLPPLPERLRAAPDVSPPPVPPLPPSVQARLAAQARAAQSLSSPPASPSSAQVAPGQGAGRRVPTAHEQEAARRRMQIDHVLHDIPPLVHGFLAEIELQKKYNPKEILSNQMTLVMGGMAKILLGGIQTGTGGLAAPFTGPLLAAVDLGTSAARAGLNADADASGALAESATKSVMITSATRAVGPVLPFAIDSGYAAASSVPVVGGLAAIGLGFMDIRAGLQGLILRPGDIVFIRQSLLEINRMRTLIGAKADEMAAIPELRGMSARWRGCGGALAVVATDLSALLAKHAPVSSSSS